MRMIQLNPKQNGFNCTCVKCGKQMRSNLGNVYADLDGKPWVDYYCESCKIKAVAAND